MFRSKYSPSSRIVVGRGGPTAYELGALMILQWPMYTIPTAAFGFL